MAFKKKEEPAKEEKVEVVSKTLVQIVRRKSGYVLVQWEDDVTLQTRSK